MKKILLVLALVPSFALASFNADLKYGTVGPQVSELQEFLTSRGHYTGPITGNFYSLTLAGVKAFQKTNGLPDTGYFGPMSREVANTLLGEDMTASLSEESAVLGGVSAPVNTDSISELNTKIQSLLGQIAELRALQASANQIQQNTNQVLGEIKANTTKPVETPVQVFVEPVVDMSDIRLDFSPEWVYAGTGHNAKAMSIVISAVGFDGKPINNIPFTFKMSNPEGKVIMTEDDFKYMAQGSPVIENCYIENRTIARCASYKTIAFESLYSLNNSPEKFFEILPGNYTVEVVGDFSGRKIAKTGVFTLDNFPPRAE